MTIRYSWRPEPTNNLKRLFQGSLKTKRKIVKKVVTYKGAEDDKYIFETETGSEVLVYKLDMNRMISELEVSN